MYDLNSFSSLEAILGIALIVIFVITALKIGKILRILEFFRDVELRKSENWQEITCDKCSGKINVSRADTGSAKCPHCGIINRIPENK